MMKSMTRQEVMILLAIFHLKDNAYLVTIRKYLVETSGKNWSVGAVYVPLDRLRKLGYLDTRIGEPNAKRGRNAVKYYLLTRLGLETLESVRKINESMWAGFSEAAYTL